MAVIGARPATSPWFLPRGGRGRTKPRSQPHRAPRPRAHRGAGRRIRRQTNVRGLIVAIVAAAGLALVYLTQSTHVAATGYEIDQLQAQLAERRAEQEQLVLQIGRAQSPAEIEARARDRLGLVLIEPDAIQFAPRSTD